MSIRVLGMREDKVLGANDTFVSYQQMFNGEINSVSHAMDVALICHNNKCFDAKVLESEFKYVARLNEYNQMMDNYRFLSETDIPNMCNENKQFLEDYKGEYEFYTKSIIEKSYSLINKWNEWIESGKIINGKKIEL